MTKDLQDVVEPSELELDANLFQPPAETDNLFGEDLSFAHLVEVGWDPECAGDSIDGDDMQSWEEPFLNEHGGYSAVDSECPDPHVVDVVERDAVVPNISACVDLAYSMLPFNAPKPVWEQGVWADIFGDGVFLKSSWTTAGLTRLPLVSMPDSSAAGSLEDLSRKPKAPRLSCTGLTYEDVVSHKPDQTWQEERESLLQSALKRWLVVISYFNARTVIRIQLDCSADEVEQLQLLADVFRGRAPSTILKRVRSAEKLCLHFGIGEFPPSEEKLYEFFAFERGRGAPASRLKGFMECLMFCRHILSMPELEPIVTSRRCMGATMSDIPSTIKQASALKVDELRILHGTLLGGEAWDKVFSGAILFATYARARWSDLMHCDQVLPDVDDEGVVQYVEGRTPSVRPLSSTEASAWLRKLLTGTKVVDADRKISIHSCKVTCLSFCAKYGVDSMSRLQLGYHSGGGTGLKMAHTYSRDAAAEPVAKLLKVLEDFRSSGFFPDCTRSGRFSKTTDQPESSLPSKPMSKSDREAGAVGGAGQLEVVDLVSEKEESGESSVEDATSSSSGVSPQEEFQEEQKRARIFLPPEPPAGSMLAMFSGSIQNPRLCTLLLLSIEECSCDPGSLVKKLPAAEKQSRFEKQQARLTGIKMVGELAPSHQLLDLANTVVESGAIIWIAPSRCSKRDDEIHANIKPGSSTVQVENATLKLSQVPVSTSADLGTDLKLMWAFQRRGLAMDSCRLLDWSFHEAWLQYMLNAMTRDCPAGFHAVRTEQVIKADQQLWTILAQENTQSLKPVNDVPVLNNAFKALTTDPRITMFLLPVPSAIPRAVNTPATKVTETGAPNVTKPAGTRKKRKLTRAQKSCPADFKDFDLKLSGQANGPICWGYNLKTGCANETTSQNGVQRCKHGFHVCANCHKGGHSVVSCRALKAKS
eukprot:s357_g12.t1